jgi:hypothetical protein
MNTVQNQYDQFLQPTLEAICDLKVDIGSPIEIGSTPKGTRRIIPILGGVVSGKIEGNILSGGADYQLLLDDVQIGHLDAKYVIKTNDSEHIFIENKALRVMSKENSMKMIKGEVVDPSAIYFRSQPSFETSSKKYKWLCQHQFIGCGVRLADAVILRFFVIK